MGREEEMRNSLIDDGMYPPEAEKQAKQIMKDCDTDNSGAIDFDEFVAARARNKLSTDAKVLHAVFNLLDHNKDGHVDKSELKEIFAGAAEDGMTEEDLNNMIDEVDT